MKKIIGVIVLTIINTCLFALAPNIQWQKALGGSLGEEAYAIFRQYFETCLKYL